MELLDYTDKSFVVVGETKSIKDKLKELGGRYNPNLTHPESKERMSAWIFSKKQKEKVQDLIQNISTTEQKISNQFEDNLGPVQRLGLKDNLPEPSKKSRKSIKKEIRAGLDSVNVSLETDSPEFQEIVSFTMIVPKIGMKITMRENEKVFSLVITEVRKNNDGYSFEFTAVNNDVSMDFVMVGREWKRLSV